MRRLRGFIILLVIAHPARLVRVPRREEGPGRRHAETRQGVQRRRRQDRRARDQVGIRRADDAPAEGIGLGDRAARRRRRPDQATVSGITSNLASMEIQRVIDENPADVAEFGLATPRVEVGVQGRRSAAPAADRAEDARRHRRLCAARRSEAGVPGPVVPRVHVQSARSFDLRDKSVLKLDREKVDSLAVTTAGRETRVREVERRMESLKAPVEARAEFSAVDGLVSRVGWPADEVAACRRHRPQGVRSREACRNGATSDRDPRRRRCCSARRRAKAASTRRTRHARRFSRSSVAAGRPEEGRVGIPAEGSVRCTVVQHDPAGDRATTDRRRVSRRRRRRTRTARKSRSGGRPRPQPVTSMPPRSRRSSSPPPAHEPRRLLQPMRRPVSTSLSSRCIQVRREQGRAGHVRPQRDDGLRRRGRLRRRGDRRRSGARRHRQGARGNQVVLASVSASASCSSRASLTVPGCATHTATDRGTSVAPPCGRRSSDRISRASSTRRSCSAACGPST